MPRKPRIHYTETDKALMWDCWRKGDSLEKVAQLFDRTHSSVARILRRTGGIRPPKRTRSRRTLSLAEREEISRGVVAGRSLHWSEPFSNHNARQRNLIPQSEISDDGIAPAHDRVFPDCIRAQTRACFDHH